MRVCCKWVMPSHKWCVLWLCVFRRASACLLLTCLLTPAVNCAWQLLNKQQLLLWQEHKRKNEAYQFADRFSYSNHMLWCTLDMYVELSLGSWRNTLPFLFLLFIFLTNSRFGSTQIQQMKLKCGLLHIYLIYFIFRSMPNFPNWGFKSIPHQ